MLKATLRGLLAHRLRLGLTGFAILLAVAFVSGTYIFTDSLHQALNNLTNSQQPDVVVSAKTQFGTQFNDELAPPTLNSSVVTTVSKVPGVADAVGWIQIRNVTMLGPDGKPLGSNQGPGSSGQGQSWISNPALAVNTLDSGQAPSNSSQVAIDTTAAKNGDFKIGQQVSIVLPSGQTVRPTITALVNRGLSGGGGGGASSLAVWDPATAAQLLLKPNEFTQIRVQAQPGVSQQTLADAIKKVVPPGTQVQTGQEITDNTAANLSSRLDFLNTFLLVFALISLFVAAFLIYNTFSMLVAQRTRELALLRAIGATRRQVTRTVLIEALVVALIATTVGILAGMGVALGLRGLFNLFGAPLPGNGLVVIPRTFLFSYLIGVVVTLVSAWIPARRAATVPPVAALRDDVSIPTRSLRIRTLFGALLIGGAIGLAYNGLRSTGDATNAATLIGISALCALIGVLALAPILARGILMVLALPFAWTSVGRLARENGRRNPRRTAATAGALMIGLTLMSLLSVVAASTTKSTDAVVNDVIGADFIVTGQNFRPMPHAVFDAVKNTPGTSVTTYSRATPALVPGGGDEGQLVTGVDPTQINQVINLDFIQGSLSDLTDGSVVLDTKTAEANGIGVGTRVLLLSQKGVVELKVVGLYAPAGFFTGYVTNLAQIEQMGALPLDLAVYIKAAPGADVSAVRTTLDNELKPFPTAQIQDQTQFKQQIHDQISRLLVFILALLVLAVIIAVLGIVNTLALSVFERTREIGLLRAIGTTRKQVRRMVFVEALLMAVFGAAVGMILGVTYGILLQRSLIPEGITELGINVGQLVLFLVLAAVGGIIAAVWPAWRASRMDVLKAISTD